VIIVYYVSGHGFGHATRSFEVIRALHRQQPDAQVIVRSAVPRWFVERSLGDSVIMAHADTDVGIVQVDSLELDEEATAREAGAFYATFDQRAAREAEWLRHTQPRLVVGDVPPLAFAAAHLAGLPSVAISNFTWDWIYAAYEAMPRLAPDVVPAIEQAYARTTLGLRLPFAGGLATMPNVRDVPLVARQSRLGREKTRRLLGLNDERPLVLASFGGHGARIDFAQVVNDSNVTLVLTDHEAREAAPPALAERLRRFTSHDLAGHGVRYEDLVAAVDVVASKPGYGIVSECIANRAAMLYTTRGHFAEYDVLVRGMSPVLRTRFLEQERLRSGRWGDAIAALLAEPEPSLTMPIDGADVAAAAILELAR
jgi:hypothetical protein